MGAWQGAVFEQRQTKQASARWRPRDCSAPPAVPPPRARTRGARVLGVKQPPRVVQQRAGGRGPDFQAGDGGRRHAAQQQVAVAADCAHACGVGHARRDLCRRVPLQQRRLQAPSRAAPAAALPRSPSTSVAKAAAPPPPMSHHRQPPSSGTSSAPTPCAGWRGGRCGS